jgi:signal transduction histidine kinase
MISTEAVRDQVRVKVSDTGIGISKDELPLLFSEFRRLTGASTTEGSGLGLYIVKNIVKGHGGTVEVESDLGVGATFILHFPFVGKRPVSRGEQHQAVAHVD